MKFKEMKRPRRKQGKRAHVNVRESSLKKNRKNYGANVVFGEELTEIGKMATEP